MDEWDQVSTIATDDEWDSVSIAESSGSGTREDFMQGTGAFSEEPLAPEFQPEEKAPVESPTWNLNDYLPGGGVPPSVLNTVGGLTNVPSNAVELGLAGMDAITGGDRAESFRENVPRHEGGFFTSLGETAGGFGTGLGVANKLLSGVKATGTIAPKVLTAVKSLFAEGGAAVGVDAETDALLIGEGGVIWEGLGKDENDTFSEDLLKKRVNLLGDAITLAAGGEAAGRLLIGTGKLVNDFLVQPVLKLGDTQSMKRTMIDDILTRLISVKEGDTPEILAARKKEIVDIIERNADVFFSLGDDEQIKYVRDTMSALEEGLGEGDEITKARARGVRSGVENKSGSNLQVAMAKPSLETEKLFKNKEALAGGEEAVDQSRQAIQSSVADDMTRMADEVTQLDTRIVKSKEDAADLIRNDPTFGSTLDKLADEVNIDLSTSQNKKIEQVIDNINEASDIMTKKKDDFYDAIPNDAQIDPATWAKVETYLDVLPKDLRDKLVNLDDNFKQINKFANYDLTNEISRLRTAGEHTKADSLRDLKRIITDEQLDFLAANGRPDVKKAAETARDYYKNTYAPFWRDGPLEDIQELGRNNRYKDATRYVESGKKLRGVISDPEQERYTAKIMDLLGTEEGKKSSGDLLDYALGDFATEVQRKINNGKLDPKDIRTIGLKAEKFVPILKKAGDEQGVKRVNDFLTKLNRMDKSTGDLELELEALKESQRISKERITSKFEGFFDDFGGTLVPKEESSYIFKDVFDNKELVRDLPDLIEKSGDKAEGLKAAYTKYMQDKLFRKEQGPAGEKLLAPVSDDEMKKLFKAGKILYKDQPEIILAMDGITKEAIKTARSKTARKASVFDTSDFRKETSRSVDFLITQAFGALNRVGARVRSGAGNVLSRLDPNDTARELMDRLMSDPHEFVKIAREVEASKRTTLSKEQKKRLYQFFSIAVPNALDEEEQTEELFPE